MKNILILFPLMFSGQILFEDNLFIFILAFSLFSITSSIIYIINDIQDVEKDRNHPIKCKRPIASNEISKNKAIYIALFLFFLVIFLFGINSSLRKGMLYVVLYFIVNLAYSFGLKNIPIVDLFLLVSGFMLRVLFGGAIFDIYVSGWLYLTVLAASLFLAIGKRRNEIIKHDSKNTRKVLTFYTVEFLDKNMYMSMGLAITFFSLWALEYSNDLMICTIPVVMMICMKYTLDLEGASEGDPIDVIFSDKILFVLGFLLFIFMSIIIYL